MVPMTGAPAPADPHPADSGRDVTTLPRALPFPSVAAPTNQSRPNVEVPILSRATDGTGR